MSAHHFGQSQLIHIRLAESDPWKHLLYLAWGAWVLFTLLSTHWQESATILSGIIEIDHLGESFWVGQGTPISIFVGLSLLLCYLALLLADKISSPAFLWECLNIIVLFTLFKTCPLLISFAIYFAAWHALRSIQLEIQGLSAQDPEVNIRSFFKQALPFSLLSFMGIGVLLLINHFFSLPINPFLLFFILISVLTLPHTFFMHQFYRDLLTPLRTTPAQDIS